MIFSLFIQQLPAQVLTKTFTKEISASENGTINLQGRTLKFYMSGTIHSTSGDEGYVLKAKKNAPPVLTIANLKVNTWEKPIVEQNITIKVTPEAGGQAEAEELLKKLQLNLSESPMGIIEAKNNLNIKRFEMINGWFKRDRNTVVLIDNTTFNIQKLEISSVLNIPKTHNLNVKLALMHLELADLDGHLKVSSLSGNITTENLKSFEGQLWHSKVNIKAMETGMLNAQTCEVNIKEVKNLTIGSNQVQINQNLGGLFSLRWSDLSSQNKYRFDNVGKLKIMESTSDKFHIGKVDTIESLYSFFSDYQVNSLNKSLNIKSKNGDLYVKKILGGFKELTVHNDVGKIELGINEIDHSILTIIKEHGLNTNLPATFKPLKSDGLSTHSFIKGDADKAGKIDIRCNQCEILFN